MAIKLDMAKSYGRVQWLFLRMSLCRMGFPECWIDFVSNCVEHCWFSVLVNGCPSGFFASSRGLRQGDRLFPSLFVLMSDYLSRGLDVVIKSHPNMIYKFRRDFPVSHLLYTDDVIIFTKASEDGLIRLMHFLDHYSLPTSQAVNIQKSNFLYYHRFVDEWGTAIHDLTGCQLGSMPITYLGVPLYKGFLKSDLFQGFKQKMLARIHELSHRYLSFGG